MSSEDPTRGLLECERRTTTGDIRQLRSPESALRRRRKYKRRHHKRRHSRLAHKIGRIHWLVLFLACMLMFGNYYCYDIPAALNVQLQQWLGSEYHEFQWQLNLLYTAYSAPNIVLPVIGGFLVDRLGPPRMLVVFSLCVVFGQACFAWGVSVRSFEAMVAGRFIFGLGGESLEVAQARITTDWFRGRGLGFALGLNLAAARTATAVNDNLSPLIQELTNTAFATWFGALVCIMSGLCGAGMIYLDRPASRMKAGVGVSCLSLPPQDEEDERAPLWRGTEGVDTEDDEEDDAGGFGRGAHARDELKALEMKALETEMAEEDKIHLSDIWQLQPSFWILCVCCIILYGSVVPFIHISSDFLQTKWYPGDPRKAGAIMSIPEIVSAVGSPLCGLLVDRYGHRGHALPIAGATLMVVHLILGFTDFDPTFGLILLGVAYSLFASVLWPCISYLVGSHQLGTAYGLVTVSLNIALSLFPLVVARILGTTQGFESVQAFFICLSFMGVLFGIVLNILDYRNGSPLQKVYYRTHSTGDENDASPGAVSDEEIWDGNNVPRRRRPVRRRGGGSETYDTDEGEASTDEERARTSEEEEEEVEEEGISEGEENDDDDDDDDDEDDEADEADITTRAVGDGVVVMIPHRMNKHSQYRPLFGRSPLDRAVLSEGDLGPTTRVHGFRGRRANGANGRVGGRRRTSSHPPPEILTTHLNVNVQGPCSYSAPPRDLSPLPSSAVSPTKKP